MSRLSKGERLEVGKALHDKSLSIVDCMKKYGVSPSCVRNWQSQYEISAGLKLPKAEDQAVQRPEYSGMSKEQLLREIMRKDIENARLKKGYAVRGGGTKKEFVSLSGKNTK